MGDHSGLRGRDLILIGMPGAGKSTVGRTIAKGAGLPFWDTDEILEQRVGAPLQKIIDGRGIAVFKELEEQCLCSLTSNGGVIATGGSVVYSKAGMAHLKRLGQLVFLEVELAELERRLGDAKQRGLVRAPGQSLKSVFGERNDLYIHFADYRVACLGQSISSLARAVATMVGIKPWPEHQGLA